MDLRRMGFALLSAAWVAGPAAPLAAMDGLPAVMDGLEVTIVIDNLRSALGQVRIALWAGPEGFTDADAAIVETGQPARSGEVRFTIPGLAPGRYAVASYHDENGNGKFDQTWIGLPDEGLGFSNGAWIGFGAPAFDEAAVEISEKNRVIAVTLRY
jgi:uncharacterized protein (DUF2141 family)